MTLRERRSHAHFTADVSFQPHQVRAIKGLGITIPQSILVWLSTAIEFRLSRYSKVHVIKNIFVLIGRDLGGVSPPVS